MLDAMQQMAETDVSPESFAGLLAALTAAKPEKPQDPPADFDGLQEDVATLSYERALHTHARYKPAAATWRPSSPAGPAARSSAPPSRLGLPSQSPAGAHAASGGKKPAVAAPPKFEAGLEQNRKRASVTIRMSKAECARLHQRAAEAGMTVSAYLRSCTFEAEELRARVKEALAEIRAGQPAPPARAGWLRLFSPRRNGDRNAAA